MRRNNAAARRANYPRRASRGSSTYDSTLDQSTHSSRVTGMRFVPNSPRATNSKEWTSFESPPTGAPSNSHHPSPSSESFMLTDKNYWVTFKDSVITWYGV